MDAPLQNETFMPVFEEITDWQLAVARRYPQASFAVLVLEPKLAPAELAGPQDKQLEEFHRAVRAAVRTSDLTARGVRNEVWMLLPHSDSEGALARLRAMFISQGVRVRLEAAGIDIVHGQPMPDNAAQLMGDLRQSLP